MVAAGFPARLAALLLLASCAREALTPADKAVSATGEVTVGAVFSESVRTTLEGLSPVWLDGDRISLFGAGRTNGEMTLRERDGGKAVFSGTADSEGPYTAVYPYREENRLEDGLILTEIPVRQQLEGSAVAPGAMVAVALGSPAPGGGTQLRFRNVCGLLRVDVKGEGITAIEVQSLDGSALAGKVKADPATGAGLDYWKDLDFSVYEDFEDFLSKNPGAHIYMATTKAHQTYADVSYGPDDYIMFGKETAGIPEEILVDYEKDCIRIPMKDDNRSLNLSNSAAIILYEALRQQQFSGLREHGQLHRLHWKSEA